MRAGEIDTGTGTRSPKASINLAQQLQAANKRIPKLSAKEVITLEPVHIKTASKIIAKVRFPKYRTSSLS